MLIEDGGLAQAAVLSKGRTTVGSDGALEARPAMKTNM
jgi:hypothetical protein